MYYTEEEYKICYELRPTGSLVDQCFCHEHVKSLRILPRLQSGKGFA